MAEEKKIVLPPIEDTYGMGAVPVGEALAQRTNQLTTALTRISALEEQQHGDSVLLATLRPKLADCESALAKSEAQVTALEEQIEELRKALGECEEYFDGRADADHNGERFIPNSEMSLLVAIRAALSSSPEVKR